jgi:hypothetical protein
MLHTIIVSTAPNNKYYVNKTSFVVHDADELWNRNTVEKYSTMMLQLCIQPLHAGVKVE